MIRKIFTIIAMVCCVSLVYAADLKISELPSIITPSGTDSIPVVQGGSTKKETLDQIATYATASVQTELDELAGRTTGTNSGDETQASIIDKLGYTSENVANKSTDTALGTSDTLYPSQKAVKTYVDNAAMTPDGVTDYNNLINKPTLTVYDPLGSADSVNTILQAQIDLKAGCSVLINGITICSNPTLTAGDVGALASNWTPTWGQVSSKPSFTTVATSGAYGDLSGRPTLGTIASHAATEYLTPTGSAAGLSTASSTTPGVMSAADKTKLNSAGGATGAWYATNTGSAYQGSYLDWPGVWHPVSDGNWHQYSNRTFTGIGLSSRGTSTQLWGDSNFDDIGSYVTDSTLAGSHFVASYRKVTIPAGLGDGGGIGGVPNVGGVPTNANYQESGSYSADGFVLSPGQYWEGIASYGRDNNGGAGVCAPIRPILAIISKVSTTCSGDAYADDAITAYAASGSQTSAANAPDNGVRIRGTFKYGLQIDSSQAVADIQSPNITVDTTGVNIPTGHVFKVNGVAVATGNVIGPGTNNDAYVPQWSGANSKTLANGLVAGQAANNLLKLDSLDSISLTGKINLNYSTANDNPGLSVTRTVSDPTSTRSPYALGGTTQLNNTTGNSTGALRGMYGVALYNGSAGANHTGILRGFDATAGNAGAGALTEASGVFSVLNITGAGDITTYYDYNATHWISSTGVAVTRYVYYAEPKPSGVTNQWDFFGSGYASFGNIAVGLGTTPTGTNNKIEVRNGIIATTQTTAPTCSCSGGSACTVGTGDTDESGVMSCTAAGGSSAITLTFNISHAKAPVCIANMQTSANPIYQTSKSTTASVFGMSSTANPVVNYVCR